MRKTGFTLAEVLVTLGIIGVVAAMTLPTVINKYKIKVLESEFKKAYAVIQNVILQMELNNISPYETYVTDTPRDEELAIKQVEDTAKFINGAKVCNNHYYTCTIRKRLSQNERLFYKTLDGKNGAHIDADAYTKKTIILPDGTTIWVGGLIYERARYYVDINGTQKGPNKLGYDLHIFKIGKIGKKLTGDKDINSVNKCSFIHSAHGPRYLGMGCTYYAIADINPDTGKRGYWKSFLK